MPELDAAIERYCTEIADYRHEIAKREGWLRVLRRKRDGLLSPAVVPG